MIEAEIHEQEIFEDFKRRTCALQNQIRGVVTNGRGYIETYPPLSEEGRELKEKRRNTLWDVQAHLWVMDNPPGARYIDSSYVFTEMRKSGEIYSITDLGEFIKRYEEIEIIGIKQQKRESTRNVLRSIERKEIIKKLLEKGWRDAEERKSIWTRE